MSGRPPIANFDSAAAMARALASYLSGRDLPILGIAPRWAAPAARGVLTLINRMPPLLKEQIYIWSGWSESVSPEKLRQIHIDSVYQWLADLYPNRRYGTAAIGSSNGAAMHLCAALGVPWLPQTFLMPVSRSGINPDDPREEAEWGSRQADEFLSSNPGIQLHHMNDPNQDRLMSQRMSYFRIKLLDLGAAYERFLRSSLNSGGTIILFECGLQWPATRCGDRHLFQFGALGGASPEEYLRGSDRVRDYLHRYGAGRDRWHAPAPDGEWPEAEWGFEPRLRDSLQQFATRYGYRIRRLVYQNPEDLSPLVAELYRWWNRKRGAGVNRLLVESFILIEPYWTIRTGSIPFWMVFNKDPSARSLESFLRQGNGFDEIYMTLFSHGVESIGLVPIEKWRALLSLARRRGSFLGVDERAYPRDFAVFGRYTHDLKRHIEARFPLPEPLGLEEFDSFMKQSSPRFGVEWL